MSVPETVPIWYLNVLVVVLSGLAALFFPRVCHRTGSARLGRGYSWGRPQGLLQPLVVAPPSPGETPVAWLSLGIAGTELGLVQAPGVGPGPVVGVVQRLARAPAGGTGPQLGGVEPTQGRDSLSPPVARTPSRGRPS